MFKKGRFLSFAMIIMMIMSFSFIMACSKKEEKKVPEQKLEEGYTSYFYAKDKELSFHGYAEYSMRVKFKEKIEGANDIKFNYTGKAEGGSGDTEEFNATYTVTDDKIIENISRSGQYPKENQCIIGTQILKDDKEVELLIGKKYLYQDRLNSIINDFVVVSGEVKVGNKWSQTFQYEDKQHEASTEIIYVDDKIFKTKTVVNDIDHYIGKQYVEERTYEKGLGLTGFTASPYFQDLNNIPKENVDYQYIEIGYGLDESIE